MKTSESPVLTLLLGKSWIDNFYDQMTIRSGSKIVSDDGGLRNLHMVLSIAVIISIFILLIVVDTKTWPIDPVVALIASVSLFIGWRDRHFRSHYLLLGAIFLLLSFVPVIGFPLKDDYYNATTVYGSIRRAAFGTFLFVGGLLDHYVFWTYTNTDSVISRQAT